MKIGEQFSFDSLAAWQTSNKAANAKGMCGHIVRGQPNPFLVEGVWVASTEPPRVCNENEGGIGGCPVHPEGCGI